MAAGMMQDGASNVALPDPDRVLHEQEVAQVVLSPISLREGLPEHVQRYDATRMLSVQPSGTLLHLTRFLERLKV